MPLCQHHFKYHQQESYFMKKHYLCDHISQTFTPNDMNKIQQLILLLTATLLCLLLPACMSNEDKVRGQLKKASELKASDSDNERLAIMLEIDDNLDPALSPELKWEVASTLGDIYYTKYQYRKAHKYLTRAVDYGRECDDKSNLGIALWNLALVVNDTDSLTQILSECRDVNRLVGNLHIENRARIHLSRFAALRNDLVQARLIYDSIIASAHNDKFIDVESKILLADISIIEKNYPEATAIINGMAPERLSLDGKVIRYTRLMHLMKSQGKYEQALLYSDSLAIYRDSINLITLSDQTSRIENGYAARIVREQGQRTIAIAIGICVTLLLSAIIFFLARQRKLKSRQLSLVKKISSLNLKLSELATGSGLHEEPVAEMEKSVAEKFRLNREFFRTLPQYSTLRQLNLLRNSDEIDRQKVKDILDAVIGQFADACTNLSQLFPALTMEDALYCAIIYAGFTKEVASVAFKASEEALRRRKSRIKQKLTPGMFEFIFG